jgi:16S rRNA (guanine527-N7)-methyltransferase
MTEAPPALDVRLEAAIAESIAYQPAGDRPTGLEPTLRRYLAQLLTANESVNLVSRKDTIDHLATFTRECLFLASVLQQDAERFDPDTRFRLLDIGPGGGFPGLVLKLALPSVEVVLVEATRKKAQFLADACRDANLSDTTVLWARAEDLGNARSKAHRPEYRHTFHWVTTKGIGSLHDATRLALPFLTVGGAHWTFKGRGLDAELRDCRRLFQQARLQKLRAVPIPGSESSVVGIRRLPAA